MTAADYILFLGITLGGLLLVLLPLFVALVVARLRNLSRKGFFACLCTVLVYGVTVAAFIAQAPLLAASTQLAPGWAALGHNSIATSVAYSAEYLGYATVLVPIVLTVVTPIWLSKRWPSLLAVLGSNNSFKPNPHQGGA